MVSSVEIMFSPFLIQLKSIPPDGGISDGLSQLKVRFNVRGGNFEKPFKLRCAQSTVSNPCTNRGRNDPTPMIERVAEC